MPANLTFDQKLYQSLIELNVVDKKKLDEVFKLSQTQQTAFAKLLIEKDLVTGDNLAKLTSDLIKVPLVHLPEIVIPKAVLKIIPEELARREKMIVFEEGKNGIKIAMADPQDGEIQKLITQKTGQKIILYLATEQDIDHTLSLYKEDLQKSFDSLFKQTIDEVGKVEDKDVPISKVVDMLIDYAYGSKASDIHIEPEEEESLIRFRVDGVLRDVAKVPKNIHDQIISRIKVLSKLRIDEHLSAQDGKMKAKMEKEDMDIRVSIVPITNGEKAVLRLLSSHSRQFGLSDLGMEANDLAKVKNGFSKPYGMVLSTGPTGSGKTTTIYAILKILNTRDKNIATIEDPVEYEIEGINQIQVNPKTNLTFAEGLRSILRQDPDIMFVGEIRDDQTAGIAINSAMTGHMVLSTLHTNDAATALPRFIDMGIEPFLVASTVNVIIGQRLVRTICEKCRYSVIVKKEDLLKQLTSDLVKKHFQDKEEIRFYLGKGCDVCHQTGYLGRIGIFEVLEVSSSIKDLITGKANSDIILKKAVEEGMSTMMDDGLQKVVKGLTTVEEVLRATKE